VKPHKKKVQKKNEADGRNAEKKGGFPPNGGITLIKGCSLNVVKGC